MRSISRMCLIPGSPNRRTDSPTPFSGITSIPCFANAVFKRTSSAAWRRARPQTWIFRFFNLCLTRSGTDPAPCRHRAAYTSPGTWWRSTREVNPPQSMVAPQREAMVSAQDCSCNAGAVEQQAKSNWNSGVKRKRDGSAGREFGKEPDSSSSLRRPAFSWLRLESGVVDRVVNPNLARLGAGRDE